MRTESDDRKENRMSAERGGTLSGVPLFRGDAAARALSLRAARDRHDRLAALQHIVLFAFTFQIRDVNGPKFFGPAREQLWSGQFWPVEN